MQTQPVITFGGSYGGMISSWMRMKFPNVITGALAASAPILHFKGATNPNEFTTIASKVINETAG
jgi:lysosomal Pro-X carboxypeptidase